MKRRVGMREISLGGAGFLLGLFIVLPFLWALSASLQTELAIFQRPPSWVPAPATVANYLYVFTGRIPEGYAVRGLLRSAITQEARMIPGGLQNSFEVAVGVIAVNVILGPLASYTFARDRFRGKEMAYLFILGSRLLPAVAVAIPTYLIVKKLGLLDTKLALILIYTAFTLPFTIWVLTLYFRSLPKDVEEAALADGCTRFAALRRVVLPLAAPGVAAIAAFSFLFSYNEFFFALLVTSTLNAKTTPVIIASISVNPDSSYTLIAVGIVLSIIIPMLLAVVFRRFITSTLVASMEQA
jgi:multiple sugar transport system permease protein